MRACMWPAWYYLIGIHATDKFDNRARAAHEAPFDRNVEKPLVFKGSANAREQTFLESVDEEVLRFQKFL